LSRPPPADRPHLSAATQITDELTAQSVRRERRLRSWLVTADLVALAAALGSTVSFAASDAPDPLGLLGFPAVVAAAKVLGLYSGDDQRIRKTTVDDLPNLARLGVLLVLGLWLSDSVLVGAPAGKMQALAVGAIFVAVAAVVRWLARRLATRRLPRERCLFVGDEMSYRRVAAVFARRRLSSDLIGRATIAPLLDASSRSPPGADSPLRELVAAERVHRVIIGPHASSNAEAFELLEAARAAGARISLLPDMLEVVGASVDLDDLWGVRLLGVRHRQLSDSSILLKRGFDLAATTVLLIAFAPLMAVIAVAIGLDSGRPVLFRQTRVGRDGVPFRLIKFRTMASQPRSNGREEVVGEDPRTTAVGRLLRRTSLDGLPQLVNVLRNSMSLVGPRPLVAREDRRVVGARRGQLQLTPGITGPWQIARRAHVAPEEMAKLDHLYVTTWTLWLDIKILLRTVPCILGSRGS
jgi:lipopolysaccharide/colanic/teichoic acid biosynthesis glycosyltransferase